jgi:hypothetical protein
MTANTSLGLTCQFKEMVATDLSHVFHDSIPIKRIEEKASVLQPQGRERVFTPANTILTMLLSSIQEDKSLQQGYQHIFPDWY